ncbi:hypothetical protein [Labilithrix luteola]|nr:hypothetical protein [Labilithrix luteola]
MVLGVLAVVVPALVMRNFTVDDALIPIRYARHLREGLGYRFDPSGPSTDGVTPLPWAFLLAPLSGGTALDALARAKWLGALGVALAGGALGLGAADLAKGDRTRIAAAAVGLVVLGLAFPVGAYAASGMETGLATALATLAAVTASRRRLVATSLLAGLAASLRPELVMWSATLALGVAVLEARWKSAAIAFGLSIAPFALCVALRLIFFGRPVPLSVLAKPSDLSHGVTYAAAAALVLLTPLLVIAPLALRRGAPIARVLVAAFVVHLVAVSLAGGDWMPYARLVVPVAPSLVLAFVDLSSLSKPAWNGARALAAIVLGVLVATNAAPAGRHVGRDRAELVERAKPLLADCKTIAALDIGWVSAASDARIVDLAGLTDPAIAVLPGGHTSKRVDTSMLLDRGVDTVLVYSETRAVEWRLLRSDLFASRFAREAEIPFGTRGASYAVYRRRAPSAQ